MRTDPMTGAVIAATVPNDWGRWDLPPLPLNDTPVKLPIYGKLKT